MSHEPIKTYTSDEVTVTYHTQRCIHAAECVRGLPAVFNTQARPWINPTRGTAEGIAAVVERCPSGALHYQRHDGGPDEAVASTALILLTADGPLHVRGDIRLQPAAETSESRLALCRCGQSAHKPFCDNSHRTAGFADAGQVTANTAEAPSPAADPSLSITPSTNGPLLLRGNFEIHSADGTTIFRGERAALCRCGGSANKPFCDGTHKQNGFSTE